MLHLHFAKQAGPVVFGITLMLIVLVIPGGAASLLGRVTRPVRAWADRQG
jgi:hypothetical protein